jgi:hypothetical protein
MPKRFNLLWGRPQDIVKTVEKELDRLDRDPDVTSGEVETEWHVVSGDSGPVVFCVLEWLETE